MQKKNQNQISNFTVFYSRKSAYKLYLSVRQNNRIYSLIIKFHENVNYEIK